MYPYLPSQTSLPGNNSQSLEVSTTVCSLYPVGGVLLMPFPLLKVTAVESGMDEQLPMRCVCNCLVTIVECKVDAHRFNPISCRCEISIDLLVMRIYRNIKLK